MAVIVPLLNELDTLPTLLATLSGTGAKEIIWVDGGSGDGSLEWLHEHAPRSHKVLQSERGRARQMNAGARHSTADMLCFVHADTVIPDSLIEKLTSECAKGEWGRFDIFFHDNRSPTRRMLKIVQSMMNWRSRVTGIATGDQAIFVDAKLFSLVGGFQQIAIMEDVALSKKLKRIKPPYCSRLCVGTSARRWQQQGVWRTITLMWFLRFSFALGVPTDKLKRMYRHIP